MKKSLGTWRAGFVLIAGLLVLGLTMGCSRDANDNPFKPGPTPTDPPTTPTNLEAAALPKGAVKLTWSASTFVKGTEHYVVDIGPSDLYPSGRSVTTDSPSFTDEGSNAWQDQSYKVRAFDGQDFSDYTEPVSFMPTLTIDDVAGWWRGALTMASPKEVGDGQLTCQIFPDSTVIGMIAPTIIMYHLGEYVIGAATPVKFTGRWTGPTINVDEQVGYFPPNTQQRCTYVDLTIRQVRWNKLDGAYSAAGMIFFQATAGIDSAYAGTGGAVDATPIERVELGCNVSTSLLNFGPVAVGDSKELYVAVWNSGEGFLKGDFASPSCENFEFLDETRFSLKFAEVTYCRVRFTPTVPGTTYSCNIINAGCSDITLYGISE